MGSVRSMVWIYALSTCNILHVTFCICVVYLPVWRRGRVVADDRLSAPMFVQSVFKRQHTHSTRAGRQFHICTDVCGKLSFRTLILFRSCYDPESFHPVRYNYYLCSLNCEVIISYLLNSNLYIPTISPRIII